MGKESQRVFIYLLMEGITQDKLRIIKPKEKDSSSNKNLFTKEIFIIINSMEKE